MRRVLRHLRPQPLRNNQWTCGLTDFGKFNTSRVCRENCGGERLSTDTVFTLSEVREFNLEHLANRHFSGVSPSVSPSVSHRLQLRHLRSSSSVSASVVSPSVSPSVITFSFTFGQSSPSVTFGLTFSFTFGGFSLRFHLRHQFRLRFHLRWFRLRFQPSVSSSVVSAFGFTFRSVSVGFTFSQRRLQSASVSPSAAGAVTIPSAVVDSKAVPPAPETSTSVRLIADAFASTTSKVIVASV